MASPQTGATTSSDETSIFKIVWFTGLSLLLYMVGRVYEMPDAIVPYYQWALGISFTGLAGCLLWFASSALQAFLRPKAVKMLDKLASAIDKLKRILGGGSGA